MGEITMSNYKKIRNLTEFKAEFKGLDDYTGEGLAALWQHLTNNDYFTFGVDGDHYILTNTFDIQRKYTEYENIEEAANKLPWVNIEECGGWICDAADNEYKTHQIISVGDEAFIIIENDC